MELSKEEKNTINQKSVKSICQCCKLAGVDFWNLPKDIRHLIVDIYQQAVKDLIEYTDKNGQMGGV